MSSYGAYAPSAAAARGRGMDDYQDEVEDYAEDYFADGIDDYGIDNAGGNGQHNDYIDYGEEREDDDRKPPPVPTIDARVPVSSSSRGASQARKSSRANARGNASGREQAQSRAQASANGDGDGGELQHVFEQSFAELAHDFVFDEDVMSTAERSKFDTINGDYMGGFAFLEEPDARGFSGLHKLINGIPYDADHHRGWDAVKKYVDYRLSEGTLKAELETYQNKTTPMLMACCRKPPVETIQTFVDTSGNEILLQKHGRYLGMIPLHFACKFFASREVISFLVTSMPDSIVMQDKGERTPVHCMLNNFETKLPDADVLRLLIRSVDEEGTVYSPAAIVNNNKCTPLHYLVYSTKSIDPDDPDDEPDRINAKECVDAYFDELDVDAITLTKELAPFSPWLVERVLTKPYVRAKLNEMMAQSFNAEVVIADILICCLIIVTYWINVMASLEARKDASYVANDDDAKVSNIPIYIGYVSSAYLLLREILQLYRLKKLKMLARYVSLWSLLDVSCAALLLASTILINTGLGNTDRVKYLFMSTGFAVWLIPVSLLKGVNYQFAMFLSGILSIIVALMPFFLIMAFTLGAFALIYEIDAHNTIICALDQSDTIDIGDIGLNFCTWQDSALKVYTMFVSGEVSEEDYTSRTSTMAVSIAFAFLVAIILLKAIVAIMTESYLHSEEKGRAFFYYHRYNLVVELKQVFNFRPNKFRSKREMETISGSLKQVMWEICRVTLADSSKGYVSKKKKKLGERWTGWKWVQKVFLGDPSSKEPTPMYRKALCLLMLAMWVPFGVATFGKIWPISLRTYLLCPKDGGDDDKANRKEETIQHSDTDLTIRKGVSS